MNSYDALSRQSVNFVVFAVAPSELEQTWSSVFFLVSSGIEALSQSESRDIGEHALQVQCVASKQLLARAISSCELVSLGAS